MALCDPDRLDGPLNRLLLLGVSARTVAAPLRDRLFAGEPDQGKLAAALKALDCEEGLVLATCRSEEHTSELQSLMRISYAVFCLKKKTKNNNNTTKATETRQ